MLEIKTIIEPAFASEAFDTKVNLDIANGWELVRRDVLVPGDRDRGPILYAELEREVEPEEEEEPEDDGTAEWDLVRDPASPLRCSACGFKTDMPLRVCPCCKKVMTNGGAR
jgi:hypothetical protein